MEPNLTIHIKMFNDKIKVMNQTNSKVMTLTAQEAKNLHADIYDLLTHCATLSRRLETDESGTISVQMDGGGF